MGFHLGYTCSYANTCLQSTLVLHSTYDLAQPWTCSTAMILCYTLNPWLDLIAVSKFYLLNLLRYCWSAPYLLPGCLSLREQHFSAMWHAPHSRRWVMRFQHTPYAFSLLLRAARRQIIALEIPEVGKQK